MFLVLGYFWLSGYINNEVAERTAPKRVSIEGEYLCLPVRVGYTDPSDCAVGMRSADGSYYAVDFGLMSQTPVKLLLGDRFSAHGIVTPIEHLSTDYWEKYEVGAIFSVTDSVAIRNDRATLEEEALDQQATSSGTVSKLVGSWVWEYTLLQSGNRSMPNHAGVFILQFTDEGTYTSSTDCNSLGGTFTQDGDILSLAPPIATKMFCENSQEGEYTTALIRVVSFALEGSRLHLYLSHNDGEMVFRAGPQ